MDISSFPCTQLVFAFSLGWTLKEVNINGDFNQYIWAFSLGWTQETDVRVTSSSLLISSGKPEEVFPTNIFSVLNECPPLSTEPKLFNTIPTQFLLSHFYPHWFSTEPNKWLTYFEGRWFSWAEFCKRAWHIWCQAHPYLKQMKKHSSSLKKLITDSHRIHEIHECTMTFVNITWQK